MTTIMTQGNSAGVRRCDGTCHNAKHDRCACICGGRYHGKGKQAQELLTRDWLGDDWKKQKAAIEAAGGSFTAVVSEAMQTAVREVLQRPLPLSPPISASPITTDASKERV